jgi:hypothetical protein
MERLVRKYEKVKTYLHYLVSNKGNNRICTIKMFMHNR